MVGVGVGVVVGSRCCVCKPHPQPRWQPVDAACTFCDDSTRLGPQQLWQHHTSLTGQPTQTRTTSSVRRPTPHCVPCYVLWCARRAMFQNRQAMADEMVRHREEVRQLELEIKAEKEYLKQVRRDFEK